MSISLPRELTLFQVTNLLLDYKVDPAIVSITIDKARSRFEQQISKPIATTSQKINLAENAKALFDEALRELN